MILLAELQNTVKSTAVPWWQVISGILAIPAALLGLMYTYRLYQKTNVEIRERYLSILEKERALGLEKPPLIVVEERYSQRRRENAAIAPVLETSWRWAAFATATLMIAVLLMVSYSYLRSTWTVTVVYPGGSERVVVGSVLTPTGKELAADGMTPEEIVELAGIEYIDRIWTPRSVRLHSIVLMALRWLTISSVLASLGSVFYLITRKRLTSKTKNTSEVWDG